MGFAEFFYIIRIFGLVEMRPLQECKTANGTIIIIIY